MRRWPSRILRSLAGRRGLAGIGLVMTAVLVGFASLVAVNAMARRTVQEEHTYAFRGTALSIDLTVGEVQIVPSAETDQISVRRRLTYGLRRPFVEEKIDGNTFRVRDGDCGVPMETACHVRWLLQVPRNLPVEVTTQTGGIIVSGLAGPVKLTSNSGSVRARTLSGPTTQLLSYQGSVTGTDIRSSHVVATSRTGDVSLTFSTQPKLVRGQSTTGAVGIVVPHSEDIYKITASAGGSKTITVPAAKPGAEASGSIWVQSEQGDISVLQSPDNA
jgi:hypothetical protein